MITFNAEMLGNAIKFAGEYGTVFLVKPPMEGLCLIASHNEDVLIYFDEDGKVVGKKYVLPLELLSRNSDRLVKAIRQIPTKVRLSFNENANQKSYSYIKACITLSYDFRDRFFNILVRTNKEKTFPALEHLHPSKNKKYLLSRRFSKYHGVDRFTKSIDPIFRFNRPSCSGKYLIFSNTSAVLMVNCLSDENENPIKEIEGPLYKLFHLDSETDIWNKAILRDFINNEISDFLKTLCPKLETNTQEMN